MWNRWLNLSKDGGPRGPATWLAFAKARGKKLSIPEWGIGGPKTVKACTEPGIDNPWWIRKWHGWLSANATSIAYESYFNAHGQGSNGEPPINGTHRLAPSSYNPQSAAAYRELWGG